MNSLTPNNKPSFKTKTKSQVLMSYKEKVTGFFLEQRVKIDPCMFNCY